MAYEFTEMGPLEMRTALSAPTGDMFARQIAEAAIDLAEKAGETNSMLLSAITNAETGMAEMLGTFGWVLEGLRRGIRYQRAGWNGDDMFIFLVNSSVFTVNREPLSSILEPGSSVAYHAHIDILTGGNNVSVWTPSVADLFASDWEEV
jgi:hypothetical protein